MPKKMRISHDVPPAVLRQREREKRKHEASIKRFKQRFQEQLTEYAGSAEFMLLLAELEKYQLEKQTQISEYSRIITAAILGLLPVFLSQTEASLSTKIVSSAIALAIMLLIVSIQFTRYRNNYHIEKALYAEFNQFGFSPINLPLEDSHLYRLVAQLEPSDDILELIYETALEEGLVGETEISLAELLAENNEANDNAHSVREQMNDDGEIRTGTRR
jgi:hypothetical protein